MTKKHTTKHTLIIVAAFFIGSNAIAQWTQKGSDIDGEAGYGYSGQSVSISDNGFILAVGEPNNGNLNGQTGHVRVLEWDGVHWVPMGADLDGDTDLDMFGQSVSLSSNGNVLAIGAPGDGNVSTSEGMVKVFLWDGSTWGQLGSTIVGSQSQDLFGYSVSISADGSRVIIGSPGSNSGSVSIYDWDGLDWVQLGATHIGESTNVAAGTSVAISGDGDIIAYGSPKSYENGSASGKVKSYRWSGTNWQLLGEILGDTFDELGTSVAIGANDSIMVIGSPRNDHNGNNAGKVSIYVRFQSSWVISANMYGEEANDWLGTSVAISDYGNIVAAGGINNGGSGYVRTIERTGSTWQTLDNIDGKSAGEEFGTSVALSELGKILAMGAPKNDDLFTNSGQVRVYEIGINGVDQIEPIEPMVYPNPCTTAVNFKNLPSETVFYTIEDIIGKKVDSGVIGEDHSIDLSNLESGTYQIQLTTGKGVITQTVVKL